MRGEFFRLYLEFVFGRERDSLSYVRLWIGKRTRLEIWNLALKLFDNWYFSLLLLVPDYEV